VIVGARFGFERLRKDKIPPDPAHRIGAGTCDADQLSTRRMVN